MRIKILRQEPGTDAAPRYQEYDVPARPDWSVMDALDYIALHLDGTLAYFRHSACDHGICGRCALKVDGKTALACTCQVGAGESLTLEPKNDKVVRDLVTQ